MDECYLFLDELKPNNVYSHFCLGGCIISRTEYKDCIIPRINALKQRIWRKESVILHEKDIRDHTTGDYAVLKNPQTENSFWGEMKNIFATCNFSTMCVGIDYQKFCAYYRGKSSITNSEYYIALQIILENFVHYLELNNAKGSVYIESRGLEPDMQLQKQYDNLQNKGTLFVDCTLFQNHLKAISFPMKFDNCIGVQLADFIPNPMARRFSNIGQRPLNLEAEIVAKAYDGNNSMVDRFGIKKVL